MITTLGELGQQFGIEILIAAGVSAKSKAFPCTHVCPACGGRLTVYENEVDGGLWCTCDRPDCQFKAGTPVCLYAVVKNLAIADALFECTKLLDIKVSRQTVEEYATALDGQRRLNRLIDDGRASGALRSDPMLAKRLQDHGLWVGASGWPLVVSRVFSVLTKRQAIGCGLPWSKFVYSLFGRRGAAVTLVAEDIPGRVCAVHSLTPKMVRDRQWHRPTLTTPLPMAGIFGLRLATEHARAGGSTLFACDDDFNWMRTQVMHTHLLGVPAPLVCFSSGTHPNCWAAIKRMDYRELVFWQLDDSVSGLRNAVVHAKLFDRGMIARLPFSRSEVMEITRVPKLLLSRLQERAIPWAAAVKDYLLAAARTEALEFLDFINLDERDWDRVLEQCTAKQSATVARLMTDSGRLRTIVYGGYQIQVVDEGRRWVHSKLTPAGKPKLATLLTDAPIVLDSIVRVDAADRTFVLGHVLFNDRELPFKADAAMFSRDPAQYVRTLLMKEGAGIPVFAPTPKSDKMWLFEVIRLLSKPQLIVDRGRSGWDDSRRKYVFPFVTISSPLVDERRSSPFVVLDSVPGWKIRHTPATSTTVGAWTGQPDNPLMVGWWAAYVCVLANMLSRRVNQPPTNIGLIVGHPQNIMARVYAQVMADLNLLDFRLTDEDSLTMFIDAQEKHDVPAGLVFSSNQQLSLLNRWLAGYDPAKPPNVITACPPRLGLLLSLAGSWRFIRSPAPANDPEGNPYTLPPMNGVVTNTLWWLVKELDSTAQESVDAQAWDPPRLFASLLSWVKSVAVPSEWVDRAVATFTAAHQMIHEVTPGGPISWGSRLLMVAAATPDVSDNVKARPFLVDELAEHNRVWIHVDQLMARLQEQQMPVIVPAGEWVSGLADVADKSHWNGVSLRVPVQGAAWVDAIRRLPSTGLNR